MNLYTEHAKSFSQSRNSPWEGWVLAKEFIKKDKIRVLDLGCGNGRFLKFLEENNYEIESYTGVDNSEQMLDEARKNKFKTKNLEFYQLDLNSEWNIENKFDLIVAFGLTHHILTNGLRQYLLTKSESLLNPDGLFIVSFWQFYKFDRFKKKVITDAKVTSKFNLGDSDYILSFGSDNAYRFCHYSNDEEITGLLKTTNLKKIKEYSSDGFNSELNKYLILKKD